MTGFSTYSDNQMKKLFFALILIFIILPTESYFSEQAYFTVNWVISGLFYLVSYISVFVSILLVTLNLNKLSIAFLSIGLLVVVPYNLYYTNDLHNLKTESDSIVHWVYQRKLKTGAFPKTISNKHDSRINYWAGKDDFMLSFYVSTPKTGHFYTLKDGWCNMDD